MAPSTAVLCGCALGNEEWPPLRGAERETPAQGPQAFRAVDEGGSSRPDSGCPGPAGRPSCCASLFLVFQSLGSASLSRGFRYMQAASACSLIYRY